MIPACASAGRGDVCLGDVSTCAICHTPYCHRHFGTHYCGEGEDTLGEGVVLPEEEPDGGYY